MLFIDAVISSVYLIFDQQNKTPVYAGVEKDYSAISHHHRTRLEGARDE